MKEEVTYEGKWNQNDYKGNQSYGEDELINFNQTSAFKCWERITYTGNKIKGPAIAVWHSVPRYKCLNSYKPG